MKKLLFVLLCTAAMASCKKDDTKPANNGGNNNNSGNNNNGGNNNGGFTPPSDNYWRINGTAASGSADAVQLNLLGNNMGLSRPFTNAGYGYCQLRVYFQGGTNGSGPDIRAAIAEGEYKEYPICKGASPSGDSVKVELDIEDNNSNTLGYYYYRGTGGKIYISKKDGKLRYTTDGVVNVNGVKYPNMQAYDYNATLEFSAVEL